MLRKDLSRIEQAVHGCCHNPSLRDDIVQRTSMRLLRAAAREERPVESFPRGYVRRIATSALVDELRWTRARPSVPITAGACLQDAGQGPEQRAASRQIGAAISSCLEQLASARREAVELYLRGHTVPEVATLLDTKPKRAENLIYRGLANLRVALKAIGLHSSS